MSIEHYLICDSCKIKANIEKSHAVKIFLVYHRVSICFGDGFYIDRDDSMRDEVFEYISLDDYPADESPYSFAKDILKKSKNYYKRNQEINNKN